MTPFDYLNSLNDKKTNLRDSLEDYAPFIVNKGLSYYADTVLLANEMNINSHLDPKMQYDFLFGTISKGKRFSKWFKPEKDDDIKFLQEALSYNRMRAEEALRLLGEEGVAQMRKDLSKGGRN